MVYHIKIRTGADWAKVGATLNKIAIKHTNRRYKQVKNILGDVAQTVARSLRARVSRAPYNYRSNKPGPHSRSGGTPLEKSIQVVQAGDGFEVVITDSPSPVPDDSKPSAYINYVKPAGTPLRYKAEAIQAGIERLKLWLNKK